MIQLYSLTSAAIKDIRLETPPRAASLSGAGLSELGPLSAAFGFLFFTIAVKGFFYGKSGMTA